MVRFYLRFTGRVQGVGFRFFAAMNAEKCHLSGWVKNMLDGSVTAEVQGTRLQIELLRPLQFQGHKYLLVRLIFVRQDVLIVHPCSQKKIKARKE